MSNPVRSRTNHYRAGNGDIMDVSCAVHKRILTTSDLEKSKDYQEMATLSQIFNHDAVEMEGGVWRWRRNLLMDWVHCHTPSLRPSWLEQKEDGRSEGHHWVTQRSGFNLNGLAEDLYQGMFTVEEYMKFYMQIGYSLSGYYEIFGSNEAWNYGLPEAKVPTPDSDHYTETLIGYMNRIHAGKVLRL